MMNAESPIDCKVPSNEPTANSTATAMESRSEIAPVWIQDPRGLFCPELDRFLPV